MKSKYQFKVHIVNTESSSKQEFHALIDHNLSHLEALVLAFDNNNASYSHVLSTACLEDSVYTQWSSECTLTFFLEKHVLESLIDVFESVVFRLECDLPPYLVVSSEVQFCP